MSTEVIKKKKILALLGPSDFLQEELFSAEKIPWLYIYPANQTFLGKLIRRAILWCGLQNLLFRYRTRNVNWAEKDFILVDEMIYPERVIHYIRKCNPQCKVVYWMWNTVEFSGIWRGYDQWRQWYKLLNLRREYQFSIVSFDNEDCRKYGLLFNRQVAARFSEYVGRGMQQIYDVFFCGRDKGRLPILMQLEEYFDSNGITYKFWILPDYNKKYTEQEKNIYSWMKNVYHIKQ